MGKIITRKPIVTTGVLVSAGDIDTVVDLAAYDAELALYLMLTLRNAGLVGGASDGTIVITPYMMASAEDAVATGFIQACQIGLSGAGGTAATQTQVTGGATTNLHRCYFIQSSADIRASCKALAIRLSHTGTAWTDGDITGEIICYT